MWQQLSNAVPVIGSWLGGKEQAKADERTMHMNERNMQADRELQLQFAKQGVQWKMEDSKQAGIHPLYALGAQTSSFSPVAQPHQSSSAKGDMIRNMGQDVSRAISATRTEDQRKAANLQLASAQADLDGKIIDNQIRATQLQKLNTPGAVGPALPDATGAPMGQGGAKKVIPSEVIASSRKNPGNQAGAINSVQYARDQDGNYVIVPSKDMKERIEDDFFAEMGWHVGNRINPVPPHPDEYPVPDGGRSWQWNMFKQKFEPSKHYPDLKSWDRAHKNYRK